MAVILLTAGFVLQANDQDLKPNLISPGDQGNATIVEQSFPTFSWTSLPWAAEYKIVVFKSNLGSNLSYEEMSASETPVIIKEIKGRAVSWTPSSTQRMETGFNYIWYVQALGSDGTEAWSDAGRYRVETPVMLSGVEDKLRDKMKEFGMVDESIDKVITGVKGDVKEVVVANKTGNNTAIKPDGVLAAVAINTGSTTSFGDNSGTGGGSNSFFGATF